MREVGEGMDSLHPERQTCTYTSAAHHAHDGLSQPASEQQEEQDNAAEYAQPEAQQRGVRVTVLPQREVECPERTDDHAESTDRLDGNHEQSRDSPAAPIGGEANQYPQNEDRDDRNRSDGVGGLLTVRLCCTGHCGLLKSYPFLFTHCCT